MDVNTLHSKGDKGKKGKGKGKNKGDRPRHDGKSKGEQSIKQRYFDGYSNQCGVNGYKKTRLCGQEQILQWHVLQVWGAWAQES